MKYFLFCLAISYSLVAVAKKDITPTDRFTISGSVKHSQTITLADLEKWKQDSLGNLIVRNKEGAIKNSLQGLKGVLLTSLLDSAGITAESHKAYSQLVIILTASDGYTNVYSWNELYNTEIGKKVYIITSINNKPLAELKDRILAFSLADINSGRRHLKALASVTVKVVE